MGDVKLFIVKLTLFSLPLIASLIVLEWRLSKITNHYNKKRFYFEQQLDSIEVLVLGSSHTALGVNPSYFSLKGFNLADISQTYYYDNQFTQRYAVKMKKLKLAIIPVSYFSLYMQLYDGPQRWRTYFYSRFWDIRYCELPIYDIRNFSLIALYSPATTLNMVKQNFEIDFDFTSELFPNGFLKADTVNIHQRITDSLGRKRVEAHTKTFRMDRYNENRYSLENLVREFKIRGVKVVFITTPVPSTYSKYCDRSILEKNKKVIASLCRKYECNYYDYLTDKRFTIEDFSDNDHLSFIGAQHLSEIINKDIIENL